MKTKKAVLGICSMLLGVLAGVFTFLPMFDTKLVSSNSTTMAKEFFGLFTTPEGLDDLFKLYQGTYNGTFKLIAAILACAVIACVVVYAVLFFADNKKGKTKYSKLRSFLGLTIACLAVAISICVFIFVIANRATGSVTKTTVAVYASNIFGVLAITVVPFLAGIFAHMAEKK